MKKQPIYRGKVTLPADMPLKSLMKYVKYCEDYMEWCCDADGRTNAYDRMARDGSPYVEDLEKRIDKENIQPKS